MNLSAFDYSGGSRSVQRSHSSSGTSSISTQSSKNRHRSKSHGDEFIKKEVRDKFIEKEVRDKFIEKGKAISAGLQYY